MNPLIFKVRGFSFFWACPLTAPRMIQTQLHSPYSCLIVGLARFSVSYSGWGRCGRACGLSVKKIYACQWLGDGWLMDRA